MCNSDPRLTWPVSEMDTWQPQHRLCRWGHSIARLLDSSLPLLLPSCP